MATKYIQDPNNPNASIPEVVKPLSTLTGDSVYGQPTKVAPTTPTPTTPTTSQDIDLSSVTGLTGEDRTNALKALSDELAKRTGVDISKLTDSGVVVDSSQIKNQESETKKEEVDTKQQEIKDLTTEAGKLKIQSDIKAYKDALGITTPKPTTTSAVADYTKLREEMGSAALDQEASSVQAEIDALTSSYKQSSTGLEGQGRGITSGLIRGQQGKLEEQYQNAKQTLEMKKANINTKIANANSVISTIMGLKQTDYSNASNDYNAQFSQQMQLSSALNSQASEEKKDANANLNVVLNSVKGTAWDELDSTAQVAIQKLALQSGIDESLVKALVDNQDIAEILTTSEGYDDAGNEIKTIIYKDKNGKAGVVETIATGGVSQTTKKGGYIDEKWLEDNIDKGTLETAAKDTENATYSTGWGPSRAYTQTFLSEYMMGMVNDLREKNYNDDEIVKILFE